MPSVVKDRLVIITDIHIPYNNVPATKTALEFIRDTKPAYVGINGDAIDFYAISRYSRDPKRRLHLADELGAFNAFLDDVAKAAGKAQIILVKGNHEQRWSSYIRDHAVELEGLAVLSFQSLLGLKKRNIVWAPAGFTYGSFRIVHGDGLFASKGGQTSHKWIDKMHSSMAVGHIHRLSIVERRTPNGTLFGVECGTLSSMDPMFDITGMADWQTGCASFTRFKNGLVIPALHNIFDNQIYGGLP
jgi:predicted phosphodiesterase